jgi:lipopolysaccharide export system protein LptC
MARADAHTRIVGWLKLALPLMALAVLSTLFLLSDRIDPEDALPFAEVDVEERAREPRMTAPTYAGTTSDGAAITLSADEARPAGDGSPAGAYGLRLQLDTPDGARTELVAASGVMEQEQRQVVLTGGVTVTTASGYRLETAELVAKLDRSGLESRAPVIASGPAGEISADRMTLEGDNQTPGSYLMVFKGSVRLVYQPGG